MFRETSAARHAFAANTRDNVNVVSNRLGKNPRWMTRLAISPIPRRFDVPGWQVEDLPAFGNKVFVNIASQVKRQIVGAFRGSVLVRIAQNDPSICFLFEENVHSPFLPKTVLRLSTPDVRPRWALTETFVPSNR